MPRRTLVFLCAAGCAFASRLSIPLAGAWGFRLDPGNAGHAQNWQGEQFAGDAIFLPGSTDEGGYGRKTSGPEKGWLSRPFVYEGPAWYQREIHIPEAWRGKRITLFLERPHWQTEVWLDGRAAGVQNSLSVPHVYDLTALAAPGRHRLTICVDNTYRIEVGRNAHSVTEHTQTNWNGIVGRIELQATEAVWIEAARLYPDPRKRSVRIVAEVRNATGAPLAAELTASLGGAPGGKPARITLSGPSQEVELALALPKAAGLWDEYQPALHEVELALAAGGVRDRLRLPFGLREIATRGTQFVLNGRPIFLRGTLECNIFPRTGYPPMDVEGWARLFRIARSYGLNHFRFHSWCPPEAAFAAADQAGFLLHVELPVWSSKAGVDPALNDFMRAEAARILKTYGNHPSFTMLCLGNELTGKYEFMDELVAELKRADPRRLYTFTADHRRRVPGPTSDYYVTHNTAGGPVRIHGARFGKSSSSTDYDFSDKVKQTSAPLVAHELGQWVVYPSYEEIASYTGVLKPRNLEAFQSQLAERGLAGEAPRFQAASGRFAWLLYKEDIEATLRTPDFGGYQLLQLQDFPGQGEALVGLLNSFWDSKGILTPEEFRRFSSETVPLARFGKFVWTSGETFTARVEVAHYGKKPLAGAVAAWAVRTDAGEVAASGKLSPVDVPVGSVTSAGTITMPLGRFREAAHLKLTVRLAGARNDWDVWVYPQKLDLPPPADVLIATAMTDREWNRLENGGKVVLLARPGGRTLPMRFLPVFWSLSWFKAQPGTLGVLCDPSHPALAGFPTDIHSNWQWWEITEGARAFVLDGTPGDLRPIVQVIDDYHRNHKLGAVFDVRVGRGRLLVSSFDLESDLDKRPAARQLRRSLLDYAASERFQPAATLDRNEIELIVGDGAAASGRKEK
ncbi:MAG: sugar-binding domain-containing protein [Acidobacteriota bacterium]